MGITSGFQTGQHAIQQEYAELGLGGGINVGRTTTDDESQPFIAPIIGKKGIAAADIFITPSSVEAEENLSLILAGGEASVGVTRRIPTEK